MVDQHGALQIRLKLLHSERSEGFAVFPDGDHSCLLMWRLCQVQRFLDASALIVSSPAFCMRGDDNWEGCLWITSELGRGLHLQLRWPKPQGFQLGKQQLSGKVGASEWTDAQGERQAFNFGPFQTLEDSRDPVSDSLLAMVRIQGISADHLKLRT